jgi:hypothetical protein
LLLPLSSTTTIIITTVNTTKYSDHYDSNARPSVHEYNNAMDDGVNCMSHPDYKFVSPKYGANDRGFVACIVTFMNGCGTYTADIK